MICRLCLKEITQIINIFDEIGTELNVAAVLAKYFWFEPKYDDPISTAICNDCWIKVSNFHDFYSTVEESHRLLTERFLYKSITNEERAQRYKNGPSQQIEVYDQHLNLQLKEQLEVRQTGDDDDDDAHNKSTFTLSHVDESCDEGGDVSFGAMTFIASSDVSKKATKDLKNADAEETCQLRRSTRTIPLNCSSLKTTKNVKELKDREDGKSSKKSSIRNGKQLDASEKVQKHHTANNGTAHTSNAIKIQEADEKITKFLLLSCEICGSVEHPTFAQIRRHMQTAHEIKGYVVCCNKKFYKRVLLVEHIEKHVNPDCFKCKDCDKVFADKQCMRNHFLLKHRTDEEKTFQCKHCPKKYAKSYLLDQHRVIHEARTHLCEMCPKGFPTKTLLFNHIKIKHSNYGTMCDICAKVITGRAAFLKHQQEHTGIPIPKVQCDQCGSWHKDKYTLQKHIRRHNEEGKLHVCSICEKVAPNRSALLSHCRYVHAAIRTFECSVCKKSFKKAINLKEHMATHTGEVLYQCQYCPRTFNSNANMHSHRKKMHPKEFEEERIKRREKASMPVTEKVADNAACEGNVHSQLLVLDEVEHRQINKILIKSDFNNHKIFTAGSV